MWSVSGINTWRKAYMYAKKNGTNRELPSHPGVFMFFWGRLMMNGGVWNDEWFHNIKLDNILWLLSRKLTSGTFQLWMNCFSYLPACTATATGKGRLLVAQEHSHRQPLNWFFYALRIIDQFCDIFTYNSNEWNQGCQSAALKWMK